MTVASSGAPLYSDLASDPDLREIVEMFVREMPDRISTIVAQFEAQDWDSLRRTAHQLKGAAGSYGFGPISPCAGRLEEAIRDRRSEDEIRRAMTELTRLCRRVSAEAPGADG